MLIQEKAQKRLLIFKSARKSNNQFVRSKKDLTRPEGGNQSRKKSRYFASFCNFTLTEVKTPPQLQCNYNSVNKPPLGFDGPPSVCLSIVCSVQMKTFYQVMITLFNIIIQFVCILHCNCIRNYPLYILTHRNPHHKL